jgi:hypothetical protein
MCMQSNDLHFISKPHIQRRYIEQEFDDWNNKCLVIGQFTLAYLLGTMGKKIKIKKFAQVCKLVEPLSHGLY